VSNLSSSARIGAAADYILSFLPADDSRALAATHNTGEAVEAA
jgi:hypothetical protein